MESLQGKQQPAQNHAKASQMYLNLELDEATLKLLVFSFFRCFAWVFEIISPSVPQLKLKKLIAEHSPQGFYDREQKP